MLWEGGRKGEASPPLPLPKASFLSPPLERGHWFFLKEIHPQNRWGGFASSPDAPPHCIGSSGSGSRSLPQPKPCSQGVQQPAVPAWEVAPYGDSVSPELHRPSRSPVGLQELDEKELALQLCKAIESQLNITLVKKDLGEALADGIILCQLANHLCPRSVPFVHMPSPAGPKLNAAKSRKNMQSFLAACRQLGLPEASLCSATDVGCLLQGNAHGVLRLLETLLLPPAAQHPLAPAEHLAGFGLFYAFVMWLLYLAYCKLCGCC